MHGAPISISISYSRRNSSFVDQLEAHLKACKFDTRVDRRKIEDSQSWKKVLKDAIDQCDVVLVVLSPASVTSPYVQMEYNYALNTGKRVLLLEHQTCSDIPIALRDIQRVNFRTKTEPGLRDLLIALNPVENELLAKSIQTDNVERDMAGASPATTFQSSAPATLVASRRESPSIELDLDALYRSGVAAIDRGNLELTAALWQQILVRDPNFRHGILASELEKLLKQLRSNHIKYFRKHGLSAQKAKKWRQAAGFWQALLALHPHRSMVSQYLEQCLRTQGKKASGSGEWELAISMWEALLKLKPDDAQATRQLSLANTNQDYAQYYKDAQQFIAENAPSPARTQLHLLWQYAPYYGDPRDLSLKVGMTKPPGSPATLDKEEEERLAKEHQEREVREAQAREQRASEQQEQAVREAQARERQAKEQQEREAREARERERRLREHQEREAQAREQRAKEQQEQEAQLTREQARKRFPAWFIRHELDTTSFIAWCSLFFLLSGLGCAVGIVTQSTPLTLGAIVITALLAYLLGYHRTIHRMPKRLQNRLKQTTREYSSLSQREDKDSDSLPVPLEERV